MEDNDFAALVISIQEAGKIRRGQGEPSRVFELMPPSEEIASSSSPDAPHKPSCGVKATSSETLKPKTRCTG